MTFKYLVYIFLLFTLDVSGISSNKETNLDWKAHTSQYGEFCVNHDQCVDFRMICSEATSVCECDQFHDWTELDPYRSECILNAQRLRTFLASQEETKPNYEDNLSEEAHNLFFYLGLAGIISISTGILLTLTCVVFVFTNGIKSHDK